MTPTPPASALRTPSDKPGGPPIKGLYGNTPQKKFGTPLNGMVGTPRGYGTPINTTPQLSFGASPASFRSFTRDHDVSDGGCLDGNTWVTVFGFPPSAACYILSQFSQCKSRVSQIPHM